MTIRACLVEQNTAVGVSVAVSDATIEATVIRATAPDAMGQAGRGVSAEDDPSTKGRATLTMAGSVVEQNHEVGIAVIGSDATIETTTVRSTLPDEKGRAAATTSLQAPQQLPAAGSSPKP